MKRLTATILLGLSMTLLLLGVLAGCAPMPAPANESADIPPIDPDILYVDGEIILTGYESTIDDLIDSLNGRLEKQETASLNFYDDGFVMVLVEYDNFETMADALAVIYELTDPRFLTPDDNRKIILADPNYKTYGPVRGGGKPGVGGSSAHSVGGGPIGPVSPADQLTQADFTRQWALSLDSVLHKGLGLYDSTAGTAPVSRTVHITGDGAKVFLFDTSPYVDGGVKTLPLAVPGHEIEKTFTVSTQQSILDRTVVTMTNPSTRSHGLFSLGLAYAVAPAAEFELVQVLDDQASGTLFELIRGVVDTVERESGALTGSVFNFSLGTCELGLLPETIKLIDGHCQRLKKVGLAVSLNCSGPPIFSLETVMRIADELGAVLVASAGNGSVEMSQPISSTLPARYDIVIGVASVESQGKRSCFSNRGNVGAPGGDGYDDGSTTCNLAVLTDTIKCNGPGCLYGVISVVLTDTVKPGPDEYAFAYWMGSSFAAPQVSGLAALALGSGTTPTDTVHVITSTAVFSDVNLGHGEVKIPAVFDTSK